MKHDLLIAFISTFYSIKFDLGASISAKLLKKSLEDVGVRIYVLTVDFSQKNKTNFYENNVFPLKLGIPISKEILTIGNYILDKLFERKIENFFKRNDYFPDVIHVQNLFSLPASVKVAKKLKIPIVGSVKDYLPKTLSSQYNFFVRIIGNRILNGRNRLYIENLKKCDKVIAVGKFIQKNLIRLGLSKDKVIIIHDPPPKWTYSNNLNEKYQSSDKKKIILFCPTRLHETKGIHILIKALKKILPNNNKLRLLIAGEGSYMENLKELTRQLRLTKYIKFLGKLPYDQIKKLYNFSDIICVPSIIQDALPRVTFEAMWMGKPVIGTTVGGIPEVVCDGKTGLLVPPNNTGKLAEAIIKLANDPELRRTMGEEGKRNINQIFNPERIINEYLNLYQTLIH